MDCDLIITKKRALVKGARRKEKGIDKTRQIWYIVNVCNHGYYFEKGKEKHENFVWFGSTKSSTQSKIFQNFFDKTNTKIENFETNKNTKK